MTNNDGTTANSFPFPEPHPWPHSANPTRIRVARDGRIALYFRWRGKDFEPTSGWIVVSVSNGLLQLEHLTDEDVADWAMVETP